MERRTSLARVPYTFGLDKRLLAFGRKDHFRTRNACENLLVTGGVGSGKTSGSGNAFRKAYLASGMGGLVLCAKPDEASTWRKAMRKAGRKRDLIIVDADAKERFNILNYAAEVLAKNGFDQNLIELMRRFAEASNVASASNNGNENAFFSDAAMHWLSHIFPILRLAEPALRLKDVYKFVSSAPKSEKQVRSPEWQDSAYCCEVIERVSNLADAGDARAAQVLEDHGNFWVNEYPNLADKTRSSIEATLLNLIYPFLTGKLAELFSTETSFLPEMARYGKVIVFDLPVLTYGPMGAAAQSIFKYLFGLAMQREMVSKKTRPVFLWIDECQFFLSATDAELLSTARSSKTCCVFITQDIPTFYAQLGHQARDVADSIIGKFGTRIFHANNCAQTNEAASKLIGKTTKYHESKNVSLGRNSGGNTHQSEYSNNAGAGDGRNQSSSQGLTSYHDYIIHPEYFSKELRTGGPKNGRRVEAILVRSGGTWRNTKAHWIKAEFRQ